MSEDDELSQLKRKRMLELRKQVLQQQQSKAEASKKVKESVNATNVLKSILIDRAEEVWEAAKNQYPDVAEQVGKAIVTAKLSGTLNEKITGEQLLWLFERVGLHIRLQTHIRIVESGEIKSIAEKLKED